MLLGKEHKNTKILEEIIDINSDLGKYSIQQINLMSPKILYKVGPFKLTVSLLLKFSREKEVLVTIGPCNIPIVDQESIKQI